MKNEIKGRREIINNKEQIIKGRGFFALFLLLSVLACENIVDTPKIQKPVKNGYGKISISFVEEETARTVLPSTVFTHYVYTFTKKGETTGVVKNPDSNGFFTLEVGSYTVAVQAYIGAAESYTLAASGVSEEFSVSTGINDPVKVPLAAVAAAEQGKFSYTITWPAGVAAEITLQQWPGLNTIALNPVNVTQGNGKTQTLGLGAGSYLLTILVVNNGLYAGISEAVRIYPVVTTVYDKNFADDDFYALIPPASNDYTISGVGWRSYDSTAKTVNVTRTESASPGAVTVFYNGTTTAPVDAGTYTVTFDVAAAGDWRAASGLPAGTLTIVNSTALTENVWADGNLPASDDVQWFRFTATASTQYIHVSFGTLTNLYVHVYDSDGATVGTETSISSNTINKYVSRSVAVGQEYYIRVWPYSSSYSGTYRIGFNATFYPPDTTQLTADTWADGNITASGGEQWFKFTATADTQYIHNGSNIGLNIQVYNSSGVAVGSETYLYRYIGSSSEYGNAYVSRSVTVGQEYYIRVRPNSSSGSGTYRIAFNATFYPPDTTQLTADTWADGNITTLGGEQWFKFTATASTQYIHVSFGTLINLWVQVYDSSGAAVGSQTRLYSSFSNGYVSRSVAVGQEYYIRVQPYDSRGTYRIAFNASTTSAPGAVTLPTSVTALTVDTWADGNLPTSSDVQWFKFTATASTQYIHVSFGTLTDLWVQVYNSSGATVGSETSISSDTTNEYVSRSVAVGQEYYIRVRPYSSYSSSYRGTYRIAFNVLPIPPGVAVTALTVDTWADGNLSTSSDVQWFKFTATASTQYIHVSFGTLTTNLYIQVYNSSGATVGSESSIFRSESRKYVNWSVTVGQEYYIRVQPHFSGSGTYRIAFNVLPIPPGAAVTPLTANIWADGNIPTSDGEQWFKFTATASTQYIHVSFGTLTNLRVQVYDSSGAAVGSSANLYSNTRYVSWSVAVGQEYYIRIWPYSSFGDSSYNSGTYRITFNVLPIPPGAAVTPLTVNTWVDGNLPTPDVQWFRFTATASTQYIHVSFGTLTSLYVQVYDSSGAAVGSQTNLYSSTRYVSRSVAVGQEYYIRIWPYSSSGSGTYQIVFNVLPISPGAAVTPLTVNTWVDGNLPTSSDVQWFKFTATADTQYIHVSFGTLTNLRVQVYDSSGAAVGSSANLYSNTRYVSRSVTVGQEYYIRIWPDSSSYNGTYNGTYQITFNASSTAPPNY